MGSIGLTYETSIRCLHQSENRSESRCFVNEQGGLPEVDCLAEGAITLEDAIVRVGKLSLFDTSCAAETTAPRRNSRH